jgi:hypothetical protein
VLSGGVQIDTTYLILIIHASKVCVNVPATRAAVGIGLNKREKPCSQLPNADGQRTILEFEFG